MSLEQDEMRDRVGRLRVVRMATVDETGRAHVVPVIFAVDGDVFCSPTDKPSERRPRPPKRLRNLERDPRVTVIADFYHEDWLKAWWVRLRGTARVIGESPERTHAISLLDRKYPQFAGDAYATDDGPVVAVDIKDWLGWAYNNRSAGARGWRAWLRRPWRRSRLSPIICRNGPWLPPDTVPRTRPNQGFSWGVSLKPGEAKPGDAEGARGRA
jgi:PPOX class probable F420-dependent enzyme